MAQSRHISQRMLVRDLVRRYPQAVDILDQHGVDPAFAHLSIELAAEASRQDPEPLISSLRESLIQPCAA